MTLTLDQVLTPDSLQQASKMFADQMALESSPTADPARTVLMELEEYCKDGSTVWVELTASFLRDNNFKPTDILTVTRDITERKKVQESLKKSEERYRLITENIADTIAVFDLNLNITTYVSPVIRNLRGYTVEEAMTQTFNQMLTPDSLQLASKMFADQMALESSPTADQARTVLMELEEYCKDGSTIWVEVAASFLRDNNFKPTGILTLTRNITERKRAEQA